MSKRLVLVVGDFQGAEAEVGSVLSEWTTAGLLDTVAWVSCRPNEKGKYHVSVCHEHSVVKQELFELLTSKIWSYVTVVAVRQKVVGQESSERFDDELVLMSLVRDAFAVHRDLVFRSTTVSVAEDKDLCSEAFNPQWDLHVLQEPIVRIDTAVASQPMTDEYRALLLTLLAMTMSGGFTWQYHPLLDELKDQTIGNQKPLRVGRAFVRVVSAGRLTDEVLMGAFPASGPWSVPPDVTNGRAVPPGTQVPDNVVNAITTIGKFSYQPWKTSKPKRPDSISILDGIRLFFLEFVAAVKGMPRQFIAMVKREVEEFVQKVTFGADSKLLLSFDPRVSHLDVDVAIDAIRNLNLGEDIDPIGDSQAWNTLQQVSLSCVDGGRLPNEVPAPMTGTNRLIFTDPASIGPSPYDSKFEVTAFEREILDMEDLPHEIGAMDVANALTLQNHLEQARRQIEVREPSAIPMAGESAAPENVIEKAEKKQKVKGPSRRSVRRAKRKAKKAQKELKKAQVTAEVNPTAVDGTSGDKEANAELENESTESIEVSEPVGSVDNGEPATSTVPPIEEKIETSDVGRHTPGHAAFNPREYLLLTPFYQGQRDDLRVEYSTENQRYENAQKSHAVTSGYWKLNRTCDHCGTAFDHGMLYLHEPSSQLVHVGHICARKSLPVQSEMDLLERRLSDLERRWFSWMTTRQGSLLWRVGMAIVQASVAARSDLARALQFLQQSPQVKVAEAAARKKFAKWTRRGFMLFIMLIGASIASAIFTPLPILLLALILTSYFSGLIVRLVLLARELVRAQYKLDQTMDEYDQMYSRARQAVGEIMRLASVHEQFEDWQSIIREVVHVPFGREIAFAQPGTGVDEVRRPPALVLGKSRPDNQQKMQLFLNARRQTIHGGWLTEIMDVLKEEWKAEYSNVRLTGPGDNILPEADNSPSGSVVGKKPLSDDDVYYPRTDFRHGVASGVLQRRLVMKKSEQIAEDLRRTPIDQLLGEVEVSGLGSALSGLPVREFLAGLAVPPPDPVNFPPNLISDVYSSQRIFGPEITLPPFGTTDADTGQIKVESGVELTAAAWRVELSGQIHPHEVLKGFESRVTAPLVTDDQVSTDDVIP